MINIYVLDKIQMRKVRQSISARSRVLLELFISVHMLERKVIIP